MASPVTINWSIKTDREGAVTILSDSRFQLPVIDADKNGDLNRLIDGNLHDFIILFPRMGRIQLFVSNWFVTDQAMPCDVMDWYNSKRK